MRKRITGILLTVAMLMMLMPAVSAEGYYMDVFYLTPPQNVSEMIAMDSTAYLEVTYYTATETTQTVRMVNVGNGIHGAVIKQNVINLEIRLKNADDMQLWMDNIEPSADPTNNMAYYEGEPPAVWGVYGPQINSPTVTGVLYFTPSSKWANEGSRFSVCFISSDDTKTYVELVPLGDGTYATADTDCANYQFSILRDDATSPNQTRYVSAKLTKHEADSNHCILIENDKLSGANAKWEKREVIENPGDTVNIFFDANGGSGMVSGITRPLNSTFSMPNSLFVPPSGKVFKAWSVNGVEYPTGESIILEQNEYTLTAIWKDAISVTYTANGGVGDDITVYISEAGPITLPENTFTAPDGKSFKAWDVNGTEYPAKKQVSISENTVIKAVWRDGCTITYEPNGGSGVKFSKFYNSSEATLEQNKFSHPEGYSFLGWEINGELYLPGVTYIIERSVVAYAKWAEAFTVEYIFESPVSNRYTFTDTVSGGDLYTIKSPYELKGITLNDRYHISGWRNGDTLYEGGQEIIVTESITVTLDYKYQLSRTFYYDENYTDEEVHTVYKDEEFIIPECSFTAPKGYMFECWQEEGNEDKKYYPGEVYKPDKSYTDAVFYAVWIEETALRFVKYTSGGAVINIPTTGTYTLIFADYENEILNDIDIVTVTVTAKEVGEITQASEKGVTLGKGDMVMLCRDMAPLCDAYIVK